MGKANYLSAAWLKLIFQAVAIANIADNAASSPLTNLYVSLHTANPGAAGTQATSEATYGAYARVAVARTTGGWAITGQSISPVAAIAFPQATSPTLPTTETEAYFGIGQAASGAGNLFYSGTVTPNIVVSQNVTPQLTTATTITEA